MQLTVDSSDPLDDVLRAVGGLFGVTLIVGQDAIDTIPDPTARHQQSKGDSRGGRPQRRRRKGADARTVREWASANGFAVSARGSLPAAVRSAYAEAHPS